MKVKNDWERVVFAELLIPDTTDVYGDFHTKESVKNFAYGFMRQGFGVEVEHTGVDRSSDGIHVVESFLAREGDPDFIAGAWVIGMFIGDDAVWQGVLDGEYGGFSYTALIKKYDVEMVVPLDVVRVGVTEPDVTDGHVHDFVVILDADGRPIAGGTSTVNGHAHKIRSHTLTEKEDGHVHIYNFVLGSKGL
ncbi:MAG: XkdF-like putative serine protease domain-containing protein [bacterium]